jgi:hypothetical protein
MPIRDTRRALKAAAILILGFVCLNGYRRDNSLISTTRHRDLQNETNQNDSKSDNGNNNNNERDVPSESEEIEPGSRPVMHTFYEPISSGGFDGVDSPMMKLWKEEWQSAGFDTKVLALADAKRHPDFDIMEKAVKEIYPDDLYNQYCFYRYLAMAADGGGWMSDNDTFPTNFPIEEGSNLPNDGKFTSFQLFVPALISASADEWTRVAMTMVDAIPRSEQWNKSDMRIMLDLFNEGKHDIDFLKMQVVDPDKVWKRGKSSKSIDCEKLGNARALHMSHKGLDDIAKRGQYPIAKEGKNLSGLERAKGAKVIMDKWREEGGCVVTTKVD